MWQQVEYGKFVWQEITEEELIEQLAKTYQPGDIPRIVTSLMNGNTEHATNGYFRFWPDGRMGNPSL